MGVLVVLVVLAGVTVVWFRTLPSAPRSISNDVTGAYLDDYVTLGLNHYGDHGQHSAVLDGVTFTHTPSSCSVEGRLVTKNDIGGEFFTTAPGVIARHFTVDARAKSPATFLVIVVHADRLGRCRVTQANYHLHHWGIPVTRSFDFHLNVDVTHPGAGPNAKPYNR